MPVSSKAVKSKHTCFISHTCADTSRGKKKNIQLTHTDNPRLEQQNKHNCAHFGNAVSLMHLREKKKNETTALITIYKLKDQHLALKESRNCHIQNQSSRPVSSFQNFPFPDTGIDKNSHPYPSYTKSN